MATLFGHFSFKLKNNGNEIEGVYLNNQISDEQPENGIRSSGVANLFAGTWKTSWIDTEPKTATLTITSTGNRFSLHWQVNGFPETYTGRGYINSNQELCGFYERN